MPPPPMENGSICLGATRAVRHTKTAFEQLDAKPEAGNGGTPRRRPAGGGCSETVIADAQPGDVRTRLADALARHPQARVAAAGCRRRTRDHGGLLGPSNLLEAHAAARTRAGAEDAEPCGRLRADTSLAVRPVIRAARADRREPAARVERARKAIDVGGARIAIDQHVRRTWRSARVVSSTGGEAAEEQVPVRSRGLHQALQHTSLFRKRGATPTIGVVSADRPASWSPRADSRQADQGRDRDITVIPCDQACKWRREGTAQRDRAGALGNAARDRVPGARLGSVRSSQRARALRAATRQLRTRGRQAGVGCCGGPCRPLVLRGALCQTRPMSCSSIVPSRAGRASWRCCPRSWRGGDAAAHRWIRCAGLCSSPDQDGCSRRRLEVRGSLAGQDSAHPSSN
jgi:hypothetical protein